MPQRYFIHTLLNLLQRAQAAIARWIKPGMEAGTTPALDPTVTVSILLAARPPRPAAPGPPRPGPGSGAQTTGRSRSRGAPAPGAPLRGSCASGKPGPREGAGCHLPRRAAPWWASLRRASPVGPAYSGRLLLREVHPGTPGCMGSPAGKQGKGKGARHFQSARFPNSPSHCGQRRCLGFCSNAIKNSEFYSGRSVLLPTVALTCLTPPAKVNKSAHNLPMVSALTCLFISSLFLLSFTCVCQIHRGSGNLLLTLLPPLPASLKWKQSKQRNAHQPTHNNLIKIASSLESEGQKNDTDTFQLNQLCQPLWMLRV